MPFLTPIARWLFIQWRCIYSGKLRKQLNDYVNKDLGRAGKYARTEVHNKIDSLMRKGRSFYRQYQKKGEMGKEATDNDIDIDMHAATAAWPNFKTSLAKIRNHSALAAEEGLLRSLGLKTMQRKLERLWTPF